MQCLRGFKRRTKGFTLPELTVVVTIMVILLAIGLPSFRSFQQNSGLANLAENIRSALYLAQNKTLANESDQNYGVFFDDNFPQRYVLFEGSSYASRDINFDQVHLLYPTTEFSQIDFSGSKETTFRPVNGETERAGFVTVRLKSQPLRTQTVYVDSLGIVTLATSTSPDDSSRIKDSRHVHVNYSRFIDSATENFVLTWSGTGGPVIKTIKISDYMQAGNFFWSGSVAVDGANQIIVMRTHQLNNPGTQISILRDRGNNTKPLQIAVDGDSSGNIMSYAADGSTAMGSSIYVTQPSWQ